MSLQSAGSRFIPGGLAFIKKNAQKNLKNPLFQLRKSLYEMHTPSAFLPILSNHHSALHPFSPKSDGSLVIQVFLKKGYLDELYELLRNKYKYRCFPELSQLVLLTKQSTSFEGVLKSLMLTRYYGYSLNKDQILVLLECAKKEGKEEYLKLAKEALDEMDE